MLNETNEVLPTPTSSLLVVEDSDEDYFALNRILNKIGVANPVRRCENGDLCLEYLEQSVSDAKSKTSLLPSFILLDLNLPGTDGREVLHSLKVHPKLKTIPVVVLTTSTNPRDIAACYDLGANAYVQKPLDYDDLTEALRSMMEFWLQTAILPSTIL